MNINVLANGNLQMSANRAEQRRIKQLIKFFGGATYGAEAGFLADQLKCHNPPQRYEQTAPCSVGALTDAPLITDGISVWGYMNYQVSSFLEEMAEGKSTIWQKG